MEQSLVETLRQQGLARLRANDPEGAIEIFDRATASPDADAEIRELISIHKAFALIHLGRDGREVKDLPKIVLRRPSPKHTLLAAYDLLIKYRLEQDYGRARFYGNVAIENVDEAGDTSFRAAIVTELGNVEVFDSKFDDAIERYEEALDLLDPSDEFKRISIRQNMGYCRIVLDDPRAGTELLRDSVDWMERNGEGYLAEACIDLCLGHLEMDELDEAKYWGEKGLAITDEHRLIRNARYLLGEVCLKAGDLEGADAHFDELLRFYPDSPHLKDLLYAIDLRSMVNWKV